MGKTINKVRIEQKHTADDYKAEKVMFVIITDGLENASRKYTVERVKARIERQKQEYGWEFIFLGANMDAVAEAGRLGISGDRAMGWLANAAGVDTVFGAVSAASAADREGNGLDE